ncbi:hypothetical protein M0805_004714 [Coniferiporia weirii]|nr:hypothetical protein M0805_004714 [Coniferiporia weirii]
MQPQVLIVGSGLTGLTLALVLLKSGIPVRVINKEPVHHIASRGAGIQPRIAEIEYILGTLSDVKAMGKDHPLVRYYDPVDPHKVVRSMHMAEAALETPAFPISKPLLVSQYLHERVFRSHVEALGGSIELGTEFSGLEQTEDGVSVKLLKTVDRRQVEENATFSFVVGADGARSVVRNALGLHFIGETQDAVRMLIADVDIKGIEEPGTHMFGSFDTVMTTIRTMFEPNRSQLFIRGAKYHEIAAECVEADLEGLQNILVRVTGRDDLQLAKIYVKGDWRLNVRMADHFQNGRVFIAGDAAHVHPPTGGQGLNSSIQDAFNLAWKLALVIQGAAPLSLLASYEAERRPIIVDMLDKSSGLLKKQRAGGQAGTETKDDPLYRERSLSQLTLNFRWSPIVLDERFSDGESRAVDAYGGVGGGLRAGDRAPDAPGLTMLAKRAATVKADGVEEIQKDAVRMFDIFDPTVHTILVFSSDTTFVRDVNEVAQKLPAQLVRTLALIPAGTETQTPVEGPMVDLVLEDSEGHAFTGYELDSTTSTVVIVRPDAMIGAFVKEPAGINRYFSMIFAAGL